MVQVQCEVGKYPSRPATGQMQGLGGKRAWHDMFCHTPSHVLLDIIVTDMMHVRRPEQRSLPNGVLLARLRRHVAKVGSRFS